MPPSCKVFHVAVSPCTFLYHDAAEIAVAAPSNSSPSSSSVTVTGFWWNMAGWDMEIDTDRSRCKGANVGDSGKNNINEEATAVGNGMEAETSREGEYVTFGSGCWIRL
ncbi:hypothetical protein HN51_043561 [Arachis hypogaea]